MFQEQAPSCGVGVLTRERVSGACFRSKLLRVYWLQYLPGSVFWERVSVASSLVCTGLKAGEDGKSGQGDEGGKHGNSSKGWPKWPGWRGWQRWRQ